MALSHAKELYPLESEPRVNCLYICLLMHKDPFSLDVETSDPVNKKII